MKKKHMPLILLIIFLPFSSPAQDKISVAVEAGFISAFREIAADFEEKTGVKVEATFSPAANLFGQIKNGAPYDIFLSDDERQPDLLQKEGITEGAFIYARGPTILWSVNKDFCKAANWQDALKNGKIKKVALADPLTAPYGISAKAALQKAGLWGVLKGKLVNGEDVSRSFQYASTRAVDAGFCALAAASSPQGRAGCYYEIKEAPVVVQAGCILKNAGNKICAELFTAYMMSGQAAPIKMKYGYR